MAKDERQEKLFFEKASALDHATRASLQRLRELRNEHGIDIDFKRNGIDDTMKFYVRVPSGPEGSKRPSRPAVFVIQSDGRLMLMGSQNAARPRVMQALKTFVQTFGQSWTRPNPTYYPDIWGPHVEELEQMIVSLARPQSATITVDAPAFPALTIPPATGTARPPSESNGYAPAAAAPDTIRVAANPAPPLDAATPPPLPPEALDEANLDWEGIRNDPRQRVQFARWVRLGQRDFRQALLGAYEGSCCISGWGPPDVLEAAHIEGHATSGNNAVQNGLLLRSDLHALFDDGLLRIDPDSCEVVIDDSLRSTPYYSEFHRKALRPPKHADQQPDREKLRARLKAPFQS
jgi:hypothetical protein